MKANLIPFILLLAAACTSAPDRPDSGSDNAQVSQKEPTAVASQKTDGKSASGESAAEKNTRPPVPEEKTIRFLPPVITDEPPMIDDQWEYERNYSDADFADPPPAPKSVEKEIPQVYTFVDEPAEFPGGMGAMKKYIDDNLRYPETVKELGIEGKCYVQFTVSEMGDISDIRVQRGVPDCPECDKEAVRLIKGMPKWKPGKTNGKAVKSRFNYPVTFRLQ